MKQEAIRIFIADDHDMFSEGLTALLDKNHFLIVGRALNGNDALDFLSEHHEEVDIALLDINMPGIDGLQLSDLITKKYSSVKILIVSMYEEPGYVVKALEYGALGYILKNSNKEELIDAIKSVNAGQQFIGKKLRQLLVKREQTVKKFTLTKREVEVLRLLVEEQTTNQIAARLFISTHTVESHRRNLIRKLDVKSTSGLVKFAVENYLTK